MDKRIKIIILVILLVIVNCFLIIFLNKTYVDVYISTRNIDSREKIDMIDFIKIRLPKKLYKEDMVTNDVVDYYVKNGYTIVKDSILFYSMIENFGEMNDSIHKELDKGMVNYDIYIDELKGNFFHLDKGMFIDLYLTLEINNDNVISDLLFSNVKISELYDREGAKIRNLNKQKPTSLTLVIKKEYVRILNEALKIGELSFVVGNDAYDDKKIKLNDDSILMKYFDYNGKINQYEKDF